MTDPRADEMKEPIREKGKHRFMAGTCVDCGHPLDEICSANLNIPDPRAGEESTTLRQKIEANIEATGDWKGRTPEEVAAHHESIDLDTTPIPEERAGREANGTQKMRGRPVTHEEAMKSAQRLINSHFHNKDRARMSIPTRASDDALTIVDYIRERITAERGVSRWEPLMNKEQQELSEDLIATLKAAAEKATPGQHEPLYVHSEMPVAYVKYGVISLQSGLETCRVWERNDVEFYALASPANITLLLNYIAAKDALIASLNAEISKQSKAEEELLATGEKLAEEKGESRV